MKTPFFSIIIPVYNRKNLLKIAVDSVLNQSFSDFELIIVDDGSQDEIGKIFKGMDSARLIYLFQRHQGVAAARNLGILQAKGEFICFLDSDDRFRREKLRISYEYVKKYPGYKVFHTEEIWYRKGGLLAHKKHHKKPKGWVFGFALKICCISISTACIKREIFTEIGRFDKNLKVCEDYDFWLRVTARYPVKLIPEFLTIKEGGRFDQQSKKYPALDKYRIYTINKLLKSGILDPEQKELALEELHRKCRIYIQGAEKRNKIRAAGYYKKLLDSYSLE